MPFGDIRIDKGKAPCFVPFKKINLHPNQKHKMFLFYQYLYSRNFELLIISFWFVETQSIGNASTTSAFYTNP